jgi:hypothetical protein
MVWGCTADRYESIAWWNRVRGDAYPLDAISREVPETPEEPQAAPPCPDLPLTHYAGEVIAYERSVRVAESFQAKLRALEGLVAELATAHYGRAPRRILHFGAYACRTVTGRDDRLSEHALGNAIDVSGFSFARLPTSKPVPEALPAQLRRPFVVSVRRHWDAPDQEGPAAVHRQFLRSLVDGLLADRLFRGFAAYPGHLHLDYAPWRYTRL